MRDGFSCLCPGWCRLYHFVWGQGRPASRVIFKFSGDLWIQRFLVWSEKVQEKGGRCGAWPHQLKRRFIMSVSLKQLEHSAGNIPIEEAFVQKKVEMDHLLSDKSFGFIKVLIIGFLVWGLECFAQGKPLAERYADAYKAYLGASCPVPEDGIRHFVYFARDREAMHGHAFLENPRFEGAQIMYPWVHLESAEGVYDFSLIEADVAYLESKGKKLFIQLQDTTFSPTFKATPEYLHTGFYDQGDIRTKTDEGVHEGWAAKRWNKQVQKRFTLLIKALGDRFDGVVAGINLQETAIGVGEGADASFSHVGYVEAIKANMVALKRGFPKSAKLQYANFMPGEWLPWEDQGYLESIYMYGEQIGVGLGAPDLMVRRKGQLNHALAMMHEHDFTVPLGIAVQDGNYIGMTGADFPPGVEGQPPHESPRTAQKNIVPLLHAFASDFLKVDFMFWVNQEPYFEDHVLPCFASEGE